MTRVIFIHRGDTLSCSCGNTPEADGFFPCDLDNNEIDPTIDSDWDGVYKCGRCEVWHKFALKTGE